MSTAKAVEQSASHSRGAAASRPNRRGGPRSPNHSSPRSTGSRTDGRPGTASHRRPFQRLPRTSIRCGVIFRSAHAQVDFALGGGCPHLI